MMNKYLFVYGTLRESIQNHYANQLRSLARPVGLAYFQGLLFLVEDYPGLIDSDQAKHRVLGEVYSLPSGKQCCELLSLLNQYEECGPSDSAPTEYVRVERSIKLLNGEILTAYIYLYNHSTDELTLIESGDYLDWKAEQIV